MLQCCYSTPIRFNRRCIVSATMNSYCDVDSAKIKLLVRATSPVLLHSFKYYNVSNASLRFLLYLCQCYYAAAATISQNFQAVAVTFVVNADCFYDAANAVAGMNTRKFLKLSMLIWLDCLSLMSPTDLGAIQGWFRHSATDPRLLELKRETVKIFRPCRSITAFQSRVLVHTVHSVKR
jgi:hypothetical protein